MKKFFIYTTIFLSSTLFALNPYNLNSINPKFVQETSIRWGAGIPIWNGDDEASWVNDMAIGNVDNDEINEIVTAGVGSDRNLIVWDVTDGILDHEYFYSYRYLDGGVYRETWFNSCFIADVDDDGKNEILTSGQYEDGATATHPILVVWKWNGSGFTPSDPPYTPTVGDNQEGHFYFVYVADVDNLPDNKKEIILATTVWGDPDRFPVELYTSAEIKVGNWNGSAFIEKDPSGTDRKWNGSYTNSGGVERLTCYDVDNDGIIEIITAGTTGENAKYGDVHILGWNGTTFNEEARHSWDRKYDHHSDGVAAGDIDGDGITEILVGGSYSDGLGDPLHLYYEFYIFHQSGSNLDIEYDGCDYIPGRAGLNTFCLFDIDRDIDKEIMMGETWPVSVPSISIRYWDFRTKNQIYDEYQKSSMTLDRGGVTDIDAYDVDNDGVEEMIFVTTEAYVPHNTLCVYQEASLTSDLPGATAYNNQRKTVLDENGNLHSVIAWWDNKILYSMSDDGGNYWKNKYVIGEGCFPTMAIDNEGGINICWASSDGELLFRRKDPSLGWENVATVTPLSGTFSYIAPPSMEIDLINNNVHIAVEHYTTSGGGGFVPMKLWYCNFNIDDYPNNMPLNVYYIQLDCWDQWSGWPQSPSLSLFDGKPHICWERIIGDPQINQEKDIYYRYWTGSAWEPSTPFLVSDGTGHSQHPSIDVHDGYLRVIYERDDDNDIWFRGKDITGTWGNIVKQCATSGTSNSPQIYGSIAVWADNSNGQYDICGTATGWAGLQKLSTNAVNIDATYPQIFIKHGTPVKIYCTWTENNSSPYQVKVNCIPTNIYELPSIITEPIEIPQNSICSVAGNTVISSGVTLTIGAGTKVYCSNSGEDRGRLIVEDGGYLFANSTTFISDSLGTPSSKWQGIKVENGGYAEIRGCDIKNAIYGIYTDGTVLAMNNYITSDSIGIYVHSNANLVALGNLGDENVWNDGMNSIYDNTVWNLYNVTNDSIFAQANYWGTFDTTQLKISGLVKYTPFGVDWQGEDWIIASDTTIYGTYWNVGTFKINSSKTAKVAPKSIDTTGWIAIKADSFDIQGNFVADSAGWGPGEGPGAGTAGATAYGAGGAGHGGKGGVGGCNIQGDTSKYGGCAYDTLENPCALGSGGGNADATYKGGAGGGIIRLISDGTINIAGVIKSDGMPGATSGGNKAAGGGSGGSVWLQGKTLTGNGLVSCKGGNGGNGTCDGGAGAGGRLNLWYEQSSFTGRVDVSGGLGYDNAQSGQMGTALIHQLDDSVKLVLSPVQVLSSTDSRFGFINGVEFTDRYIKLTAGDSIVGNLKARALDSIIINSSSYIIADEKGYRHGQGTGYGHAGSSSHGGGGAGYGGPGGWGSYHVSGGTGDSGISYGGALLPEDLGSGGGDWGTVNGYRLGGGNAGGAIELQCYNGKILLDGTLSINGSDGTSKTGYAGGGASGGSALIYAKYLTGNGIIQANGGNGGAISNCYAGGGAGGRVCLYMDSTDFDTTYNTTHILVAGGDSGGTGATNGKPGTIHYDVLPEEYTPVSLTVNTGSPFIFKLNQNYPNPFRNKTTLQYSIASTCDISLKLYDLSGRCVKTLVEGRNQLPGIYKVDLNARDYPAGIYFAKYIAGKYKETKKLVLMR